jgi:chromosome segregation ATPase
LQFHFLTFGVATLIAGGLPDPFHLEADLANARRALDEVQNQRNSTLERISKLRDEEQRLKQLLIQGQQLEGELPQLSNTAAATQSRCVTLQSRFSTLKDTASRLASQVKRVVGDMSVVRQAVTKEEFAVLLLNLCSDAMLVLHHDATLIDSDLRLVDAIKAVEGELVGYKARLLNGVEDEWD